ncbi:hypothetical protein SO802_032365 [Lithocarpus litseifolius]|uniref:Uncharacterized protein n=1 Tax=Lithocarpus litseifolius TaxID=425828 RepID=A0AAW2BN31_9ROSI
MASTSLAFPSLQPKFQSSRKSSKPSMRRFIVCPVTASVSEKPSMLVPPATVAAQPEPTKLLIKKIPGNYGLPFVGPIRDRLIISITKAVMNISSLKPKSTSQRCSEPTCHWVLSLLRTQTSSSCSTGKAFSCYLT